MMQNTFNLWVGGAAGDGIASCGETFIKLCSRSGLHAYAYNSYQSVIRGGHVLFQSSVGPEKVWTQSDDCDILIALNQDTLDRETKDARKGVLFNSDRFKLNLNDLKRGAQPYGLPISKLATNALMQNTVALGALMHLAGLPFEKLAQLLKDAFKKKGAQVQEANVLAAKAGYDYAIQNFPDSGIVLPTDSTRRLLMTGNQAFALGALAAGCKFYSAYPMTPASSIMHYLAPRASKYGMVFKQTEDEIAALNMAIGAGHAGVRAMTGTSGGGFSLMTEAVGLAAMIEAPVVIVEVQRGGPSTGLPTKTEQADLFQVLGASQGDYPKIVIAPLTVEDAFYSTVEAFNLAEKYQCPVIIMSDLLLSEHQETVEDLNLNVPIDRGVWAKPVGENFKRYLDADTGVSPRAIPGQEDFVYVAGSDEHNEKGELISDVGTDPAMRIKMMNKRMRKLEYAAKDLKPPMLEGPKDAELTVVGWGSSYNMMRRMMEAFNRNGQNRVNILPIRTIWPFPWKEVSEVLYRARKVMMMECNFTSQMARLIRQETGFFIQHKWLKYDGEPFYPGTTYEKIEEVLKNG
ncbi:MAG: 2-oxoacid:acceptor oxidoreductase subunit alpha [Elusimicrobia bacterium]|nr:2-oxoacid:acceptor oxidoreductase subunit alpha [Elusimicrobiota bacterium]